MINKIITFILVAIVLSSLGYMIVSVVPTKEESQAKLYAQPVGCVLKETHIPITNYGHYNKYDCKGVITWVKERQ